MAKSPSSKRGTAIIAEIINNSITYSLFTAINKIPIMKNKIATAAPRINV